MTRRQGRKKRDERDTKMRVEERSSRKAKRKEREKTRWRKMDKKRR